MDESRPRSSANDPDFLEGLAELDRGLGVDDEMPRPRRKPPVTKPQPAKVGPFPTPSAADIPIVIQPGSNRPLLDLFPPPPLALADPPDVPLGIAPPPQLTRPLRARTTLPAGERVRSYETFYGLTEPPFALMPDTRFLYHSTEHDRGAQHLLESIGRRDRIVLVTGSVGIGKTMLCAAIAEQLDRRTVTSFVRQPIASVHDLLQTVLVDFGVMSRDELERHPPSGASGLAETLESFAGSLASLQAAALVIIDDAESVPVDVLAKLCRLANRLGDAFQLVLAGPPALLLLLNRQELAGLRESATTRIELGPLAADEVPGYVMHRLQVAGESPRVDFDDGAMQRLFEVSAGVPRTVNQVCDRALARACDLSAAVIDARAIDLAAADLGVAAPSSPARDLAGVVVAGLLLFALAALGAAGAAWIFSDRMHRAMVTWSSPPPAPRRPAFAQPPQLVPLPPPR